MRRLAVIAAAALALAAPPPAGAEPSAAETLRALRQLDVRVASVGYRLARGAVDLCADRRPLHGIVPHDLSQYDEGFRDAAAAAFGLGAGPSVLALARDSGAARAGLRPDDRLVSADGTVFPAGPPPGKAASPARADQAAAMLDAAFADGHAELEIVRAGARRAIAVAAEMGCPSRFQVEPSASLQARADGRIVEISSGLVAFAEREEELAALLAHELAHNILRHRDRLDRAGIRRGLLRYFGRNARLIRATEREADRLSVYLLDRAGYPPQAAAALWERFGPRRQGLFGSMPTHPDWKDRVAMLREEEARLAAMKARGETPLPLFMTAEGGR